DTFESTEKENSFEDILFNENNARLEKQLNESIFVILGNPPYSAKQQSDNTNYASTSYRKLDKSIEENYAAFTAVQNKQSLYDSYIRAFRWATDRLEKKGIVAFITNNSFIDGRVMNGVRKSFHEE